MTLLDFQGTWHLRRQITHAQGEEAVFTGQAVWTARNGGMDYHETGQLQIGDTAPIEATQRYHWDADLNVYFPDGRFFHTVPGQGGKTAHWCDPDQYDGAYDFAAWPDFTVTWRVRGPRKHYRMVSTFSRRSAHP